jgi:hypothetical protein
VSCVVYQKLTQPIADLLNQVLQLITGGCIHLFEALRVWRAAIGVDAVRAVSCLKPALRIGCYLWQRRSFS